MTELARVYSVLKSIRMIYRGKLDTFQGQALNKWGFIWLHCLVKRVNVSWVIVLFSRFPDGSTTMPQVPIGSFQIVVMLHPRLNFYQWADQRPGRSCSDTRSEADTADARFKVPDTLHRPESSAKPNKMEDFQLLLFNFMWFQNSEAQAPD